MLHSRNVAGLDLAGGVRAQPRAEELRTFVDTIGELDGLEVGSMLAEKMVGAPAAPSPSRADSSFRTTLVAALAVHVVKPKRSHVQVSSQLVQHVANPFHHLSE